MKKTMYRMVLLLTDPQITRLWVTIAFALVILVFWISHKVNFKNLLNLNDDLENIESIPEALINIDEHNFIMKANDNVEDVFGYMKTELKKVHISKLLSKENMQAFDNFKSRGWRKGVFLFLKTKVKNGELIDIEIATRKYIDFANKVKFTVVVRDVSHRKATELFLRTEFERQTVAVHAQMMLLQKGENIARTGTWEWDLETRKVTVTPGFRRAYNVSMTDDLTSDMLMELVYPEDIPEVGKVINQKLLELSGYEVSFRRMQKDGRLGTIFVRAEPLLSEDRTEVVKVFGIIQLVG